MENLNHPSAEQIYCDLAKLMPTLSKTTIYNTIKLFENNDVIVSLGIDNKTVRYDANCEPHAHFRCKQCGAIHDIPLLLDMAKTKLMNKNLQIDNMMVYFTGLCDKCRYQLTK